MVALPAHAARCGPTERGLSCSTEESWYVRVTVRQLSKGLLLVVCAAVVGWLIAKATEGGLTFLQVTLNGITLAALYFVVAAGFTLIFGLMRVVNMAHGSLYLFGGYMAYIAQTHWYGGGASQFSL